MQLFFETCANEQLEEDNVLPTVMEWCTEARIQRNPRRSLHRAIDRGCRTKSHGLLERFCRDKLKITVRPGTFDVSGYVRDYFGEFSRKNQDFSGAMERCCGDFEVVRLGTRDIEDGVDPGKIEWANPERQVYDLKIWSPDGRGNFAFRYSDRTDGEKRHNHSLWVGHAFATLDAFYLLGVDLESGKDAVLFILQQHPEFGYDILVGMQLAKLEDDDPASGEKAEREVGVSRRVAAFRLSSRRYQRSRLEAAARDWVTQPPMGAVITYRSSSRLRRRDT